MALPTSGEAEGEVRDLDFNKHKPLNQSSSKNIGTKRKEDSRQFRSGSKAAYENE